MGTEKTLVIIMKRKLITDNGNETVRILLKSLGLEYGWNNKIRHMGYPTFPSFNSIAYILSFYGIESSLLKTNKKELTQLPMPAVINYNGLFFPVLEVSNNDIYILNECGGVDKKPVSMLNQLWTGTALIFDTTNAKNNKASFKSKLKYWFNRAMPLTLCISILSAYLYFLLEKQRYLSWEWCGFYSVSIIGLGICILFQIQEFDRGNSFVNRICHPRSDIHDKTSCASILDSTDSRFVDLFSWADFGLLYFVYLTILPAILTTEVYINIAAIFSILASVYIPYSLIYQWKFAREWCPLCLLTQSVLLVNFVLAIFVLFSANFTMQLLEISELLKSAVIGVVVVACVSTAKQVFSAYKKKETDSVNYSRMKHTTEIMEILMPWQNRINMDNLFKITSGKTAEHNVTMIINPVCSPCMKKLRSFFLIYKNKKHTQLEIIFLTDKQGSRSFQIASYITFCFYLNHEKGLKFLEYYAKHFPVSKNSVPKDFHSSITDEVVIKQYLWCCKNNITSTPKVLIDGRELPMIYDINDIDYMIR